MTEVRGGVFRRPALAIGFELWLFVFVAFAGTTLLFPHPILRLGAILLFAAPVLAWAILRVRGPFDMLDVAILAAIGAHLVVSLSSLDREGSLEASAIVVVYAGVYWLARRIGADPELRRVAVVAVVMALAFWIAVIAVTWVVEKAIDTGTFGWPPRLDAHQPWVWGSINTPPVLLLLAAPFVAWLPSGILRRVLLTVLAASAVVIIPFSVGRAAWLGIAVAVVSAEVLFGFPVISRLRAAFSGHIGRSVLPTLGAVGVAALLLVLVRLEQIAAAMDSRVRLWQQAWGLFAADPLTGAGPTTFGWARLAHVPDFTDRVAAGAAHNVPMQTLAEGGLLLAAAMLLLVAAWTSGVIARRDQLDRAQRVAIAVLIGFAAFSMLDDFSFLPAVIILVIILAAWALPPTPAGSPRDSATGPRALLVPGALAVAALMSVPTAVSLGTMRIGLAEARMAAVDGRWDDAVGGIRRAAEAQPSNALHWLSLGLAEHHLGRDDAAVDAYSAARDASPGDPRAWGALAVLAPNEEEERRLLEEAARRSNDPQYAYRLAAALRAAGDDAGATDYLAIASVIEPRLYASVAREMQPDVRAALPRAVATVGSLAGLDPHEVEWNASLGADEVHAGASVQWRVARDVDTGDVPAAMASLTAARREGPHAPHTWEAASAVARMTCDRGEFERAEATLDLAGRAPNPLQHAVVIRRPGLYREPDLGDYQPLEGPSLPDLRQWPLGLIEVPDCGW